MTLFLKPNTQKDRRISDRRKTKSDPVLRVGLFLVAGLGCLVGLVLYFWAASADLRANERARLSASAQAGALRLDRHLARVDADLATLAPIAASALAQDTDAKTMRAARRDALDVLAASTIAGVLFETRDGETRFDLRTPHGRQREAGVTAPPLERNARLLSEQRRFAANPGAGLLIYYPEARPGTDVRVVAELDLSAVKRALVPDFAGANLAAAFLVDGQNRVLAKLGADTVMEAASLNTPERPANLSPLTDTIVSAQRLATTTGASFAASSRLDIADLAVVHAGEPLTVRSLLHRAGGLALIVFGPVVLSVLLCVSLIQNEWRKHDTRDRSNSNAAARADIAANLLQAGIIDWSVADAQISYSDGWRAMMGYEDAVAGEEIYDWIDRIHPDDRPAARAAYQRLMDGGRLTLDHAFRLKDAHGGYIKVDERAAVRVSAEGEPFRIILVQTKATTPNTDKVEAAA